MKRFLSLLIIFLAFSHLLMANETGSDYLRDTGKIYVVFAVILSIFAGLFSFLIWMERRITRIEKQINPS